MTQKLISIGQIIKTGWQLYSENINKFIYPILILILPYIALFLVGYFEVQPNVILSISLTAIAIVLNLWLAIFFIELINNIYTKKQADQDNLYEIAFRKIPSYFVVAVLVGIITILGFILLIIPGVIFAIWYSFAIYINILEKKDNKGWTALKRSKELVKGRWGKTFWRLLIPPLAIYALSMVVVIGLMFMLTGGQVSLENPQHALLYNTLSTVIILILSPLFTSFYIILYNSLKDTKNTKTETEA
ncbi:hypothetical protein ACFL2U_03250 [Patescibacteria group bacterium]